MNSLIGALARLDFKIEGLPNLGDIELDASAEGRLESELVTNRLIGLAARAIEAGHLDVSPATAESIVRRHDADMAATLRIEAMLLRVADILTAVGVTFRVLKGSALAHTVAMTPSDRSFRDVDLLVPSAEIDTAVGTLQRVGARRHQPELRRGFDRRFAKSVTMTLDGVEIDLHRTLAPGPFGAMMFPADLFLFKDSFEVGGSTLSTLDRTDHLLHACYHAALGSRTPAATNVRDIALLAAGPIDMMRVNDSLQRWHGEAVMGRAVEIVGNTLGPVLSKSLRLYTLDADDHALLEPYLRTGDRFPALAAATLRSLPLADRPAYALAIGLPEGASVVDRVKTIRRRNPFNR